MRLQSALLIFSASVLLAQGPMPQPGELMDPMGEMGEMMGGPMGAPARKGAPPVDEIKAYLNLDQAQIDKLNQIQKDSREGRQAAMRKMQDTGRALREALEAANPDPAVVGKFVIEMQASRKQMQEAREQLHKQAVAVLTEGQKTKLAELQATVRKMQPAIGQARSLNLLEPPETMPMMGPEGGRRPGRMGMRPAGPGGQFPH